MRKELLNVLAKVAKVGVEVVAGLVAIKLTTEVIYKSQVTQNNIKRLYRMVGRFVADNEDLIRRESALTSLPSLILDESLYVRGHELHKVLAMTNISSYNSNQTMVYADFKAKEESSKNICLVLSNLIGLYGFDKAYEQACLFYLEFTQEPVATMIRDRDTKESRKHVERQAKRIYKKCVH